MTWRYQAVYLERDMGEKEYSICEIYLDKNGKLEAWTENHQMSPYGFTLKELRGDLRIMMKDVRKWKPVDFNSLQIGMTFKRRK